MKSFVFSKNQLVRALLLILIFLSPFILRPIFESKSLLAKANNLSSANKLNVALTKYYEAARWQSVLNPWGHEALRQLKIISENSSDPNIRMEALRLYRSAEISSANLTENENKSVFKRPGFFGFLSSVSFIGWVVMTLGMIKGRILRSGLVITSNVMLFSVWLFCLSLA